MFKYYNRNPKKEKLPDCVCRAISLATECEYMDVMRLLYRNGGTKNCDELCVDCYSQMLDDIGYQQYDANKKTVAEIADQHQDKRLLIRIDGHLTCCIDGTCYDIWDCTQETADIYWIVE